MKRILFMAIVLLCCGYSAAQRSPKLKWKDTVNYVACRYAYAYISKENTDDKAAFEKSGGLKTLEKVKSVEDAISPDSLEVLLKANYVKTFNSLIKPILDKVSKPSDVENLIDLSHSKNHGGKEYMKACQSALREELKPKESTEFKDDPPSQKTAGEGEYEGSEDENSGMDGNTIWLVLLTIVAVVEGAVIIYLYRHRLSEDKVKDLCKESGRVEEKIQNVIDKSLKPVDTTMMDTLKKEIGVLQDDVARLKRNSAGQQPSQQNINSVSQNQQNQDPQEKIIFAKVFGENQLKECSSAELKFYKLYITASNANMAEYEFCSNDSNALDKAFSNLNVNVRQVCDIQGGIPPAPKYITTVNKGQANLEGNVWVVKRKAKIQIK